MWSDEFIKKNKSIQPDLLVVINASPYEVEKFSTRKKIAKKNVRAYKSALIYLNNIGCQDELIFDGGSFFMNKNEEMIYQEKFFSESEKILDLEKIVLTNKTQINKDKISLLYDALVYSLKNYMRDNFFKNVTIGLSGGIDSALCTIIAVDALGSENVKPVFMPTKYTSNESEVDSNELSKNLNLEMINIPIELLRKKVLSDLNFLFKNFNEDITEENIQSRIRGLLLMALSNKFKSLLIATGNKSELSVGYSTLYGDMCGGFSLIKDIYKTQVIELVKWRNKNFPEKTNLKKLNLIPQNIITKDPTAELKFNQKDTDSLPGYEILDKILEFLIDKNYDIKKIKTFGFNQAMIKRIWKMVKNSEFKRYQSAIGPKFQTCLLIKTDDFQLLINFQFNMLRFAPSPTGNLHIGNARVALLNYLYAKNKKLDFFLRIDDTDKERSDEKFVESIVDDLSWLGISFSKIIRQSNRLSIYEDIFNELKKKKLIYPCFETQDELSLKRKIQLKQGKPPIYDRSSLKLNKKEISNLISTGKLPHWRLKLDERPISWNDEIHGLVKFDNLSISDPVLFRSDEMPLFTITSVVDDADLKVTNILRGDDHITNTAAQIKLFQYLGSSIPNFAHFPLMRTKSGTGLSKRLNSFFLKRNKKRNILPIIVLNYLSKIGSSLSIDNLDNIENLIKNFEIEKFSKKLSFI